MKAYLRIIVGGAAASLVGGAAMFLLLQAQPAAVIPGALGSEVEAIAAMKEEMAQLRGEVADLRLERGKPAETPQSGGSDEDLRKEIEELRDLVAMVQDHQQQVALRLAGDDADAGLIEEAAWDEARDPEEEMAEAKELVRHHFSTIESAYQAESVDQAWSAAVVDRAHEAFASDEDLIGVTLSDVDCRSSRCRLEIWFDGDEVDADDIELALAENMSKETPSLAIHYLEDGGTGTGTAVVYLARKGYGLVPN